jgi:hypothetical protein
MPSTDRLVDLPEKDQRVVEEVIRGIAATDVRRASKPSLSTHVHRAPFAISVSGSVVLVDRVRPTDQEVHSAEEEPSLIEQLYLRLHGDPDRYVEQAQLGFPRGL